MRRFLSIILLGMLLMSTSVYAADKQTDKQIPATLLRELNKKGIAILPMEKTGSMSDDACQMTFKPNGSFSCSQIICGDSSCPITYDGQCSLPAKSAPGQKPLLECKYTQTCESSRCSRIHGKFLLPLPGSFTFELLFGSGSDLEEKWDHVLNVPDGVERGCVWRGALRADGSFRCSVSTFSNKQLNVYGSCPLHKTPDDAKKVICTTSKLCPCDDRGKERPANQCTSHVVSFEVNRPSPDEPTEPDPLTKP